MAKPVLLLMGPTASGKTDLALAIASRWPVRLVSVDSVMVYRGLDIGTAKPSPDVLVRWPHDLIDIRDPSEPYSAAGFREDALRCIHAAHQQGRLPLLVGGTSLYFHVLQSGLSELPEADPALRRRVEARAARYGWPALHQELRLHDPLAAAGIPPANRQRIQRALEVFYLTGRPISHWWQQQQQTVPSDLQWLIVGLDCADRAELHRRIDARFEAMLAAGFIDEVRALHQRGDLHEALPAVRAVGYRQAWSLLEGALDYPAFVAEAKAATRQLARRQLTWMRRQNALYWLESGPDCSLPAPVCATVERWLESVAAN